MTINQYFKKRVLIGIGVGIFAIVIDVIGQYLGTDDQYHLELIGLLLFVIALLSIMLIRCPGCKTLLGMQSVEILRKRKSIFNYCPNCGLKFSETEYKPRID